MHLYGRSEIFCLSVSVEKRKDQGSESPSRRQPPCSASPCVSYLPRSFQPAPHQPQSQGANIQRGWEVLRGLERRWNGRQSSSSFYMSDCSQWTCYSWSLCPPPVLSLRMCVSVYVFVCLQVSAGSSLCCMWKQSLFPHCQCCRQLRDAEAV